MNTEAEKTCCRFFVYIFFWAAIVLLGFFLLPGGGSGGSGPGSGAGTHGTGSGRGTGTYGTGTSSEGRGDNDQSTVAAPAASEAPAKQPEKTVAPQAAPVPAVKPQKNENKPLRIMNADEASDDVATIYLPGKSGGSGAASGTSTGFFGVELQGSVIFLLDISGSMGSSGIEGNMSRLDLVKREIENTLTNKFNDAKKKNSKDHFRIVCFDNQCEFFPQKDLAGIQFNSYKNISDSITFVKQLKPRGGTSMMLAWKSIIPIIKREEIAGVYFLSDGMPNDCSNDSLLKYLKASVPELKIHTIAMGLNSQLLKDIAKQHNGQYREVF